MQDRRRHLRFDAPVLVEFQDAQAMKTEHSFTQDVSESGMRFPTSARLQVGQELAFTLDLTPQGTNLHTTGQVIWIREVSRHHGTPNYDVGVRFRWVEDPDRQQLLRYLASPSPQ